MNKDYNIICRKPQIVRVQADRFNSRIDCIQFKLEFIELEEQLTNSGLNLHTIGGLIRSKKDLTGGATPLGANYTDNGIRFIRTQDVDYNWIGIDRCVFISEENNNKLNRSQLEIGDIVLTITGVNFGKSAVVRNEILPGNISQHSVRVHFIDSIDPYFISSYLNSIYGQSQIFKNTVGVTRPAIDYDGIKSILIPVPSSIIQKHIGDKVRKAETLKIDSQRLKMESNALLSKYLGDPQFDENRYSTTYVSAKSLINRIDSEYYKQEYMDLIQVLRGKFKLLTLDTICNSKIFNGKTFKTNNKDSSYQNIGVGELGDWFPKTNYEKRIDEEVSSRYILPYESIIWGNAAHLAKYIGDKVNIVLEENSFVGTTEITSIFPDKSIISPYYVFLFMNSEWGYHQIRRTVKGMTAHSYPEDIKKILVPIIDFTDEELLKMKTGIINSYLFSKESKELIVSAKKDVEDLIEGRFEIKGDK